MKGKNSFWKMLGNYILDNAFYLVVLLFASAIIALGVSFIAQIPYKTPVILCAVIVYFIMEISHFIKYYISHKNDE